jgi:glycoside/pentoside/hexuronide:cation symporter, GPH family
MSPRSPAVSGFTSCELFLGGRRAPGRTANICVLALAKAPRARAATPGPSLDFGHLARDGEKPMQTPARKLAFPTMVAYGLGQIGERLRLAGFGVFLLFYYQQIVGLSGSLTATAIALASIFDAFTDPIMGALSDRTKTRWGRRHPFMVIGMVPLAIGFYAAFNPPQMSTAGTFLWLFFFTFLARVGSSLYHVSHMALGAEMARDYAQRSTLYSFNVFFESLTFAVGSALAYRVFFPTTPKYDPGLLNADGYQAFSLAFAIAMVLAISLSAWGTRHEIAFLPKTTPVHRFSLRRVFFDIRDLFHNRSFRALFLGLLLAALVLGVEVALTPYMGTHFFEFTTEQLSYVPIMTLIGLCIAMPLVPIVTRKFDKKRTLIASVMISVFSVHILILLRLFDPPWFPQNGSSLLLALYLASYLVFYVTSPLTFTTATSMFADIADEHELETGERREGVIFAARAFSIAMIQSLSIVITGVLLDLIAFPKAARLGSVPAETVWQLGLIPIGAAVLHALSGLLYAGYRLDRKRHAEIVVELESRRAARSATQVSSAIAAPEAGSAASASAS